MVASTRPLFGSIFWMRSSAIWTRCLPSNAVPAWAATSIDSTVFPLITHRSLLFTVAYEMLDSAADAEDVVQESWLRWADVNQAGVRDPRAYLVRTGDRGAGQ